MQWNRHETHLFKYHVQSVYYRHIGDGKWFGSAKHGNLPWLANLNRKCSDYLASEYIPLNSQWSSLCNIPIQMLKMYNSQCFQLLLGWSSCNAGWQERDLDNVYSLRCHRFDSQSPRYHMLGKITMTVNHYHTYHNCPKMCVIFL